MSTSTAEQRFHRAMVDLYKVAERDCDYKATYFLQMVLDLLQVEIPLPNLPEQNNAILLRRQLHNAETSINRLVYAGDEVDGGN